jgi:hypothetical protein
MADPRAALAPGSARVARGKRADVGTGGPTPSTPPDHASPGSGVYLPETTRSTTETEADLRFNPTLKLATGIDRPA